MIGLSTRFCDPEAAQGGLSMQTELTEIVTRAVLEQPGRSEIREHCPACDPRKEHRQNLSIDTREGVCHCFRCEAGGKLQGAQHSPNRSVEKKPKLLPDAELTDHARAANIAITLWKISDYAQASHLHLRRKLLPPINLRETFSFNVNIQF